MKEFRTIEISDPEFERDHLRFITVKSNSLKGRGDICVFVPPGIENMKDVPLVILLHGVYGSSWSWALSGGVHHAAFNLIQNKLISPMLVAMPSDGLWGDGSGYVAHHGLDFEKWIAEEVPAVIKKCFPSVTSFSRFFIGGLSMGGFGALKIGVKYSDRFQAVSAHSSITNLQQMKLFAEESLSSYLQNEKTENDILETILKNRNQLPALRFDCGVSDTLIEENRQLHLQLLRNKIPHIYEECGGAHEWIYWQKQVIPSLRFFNQIMIELNIK